MPEAIENYVPQNAVAEIRQRAFYVWAGFSFLVAAWTCLILLAPLAEAEDFSNVSHLLYKFFGFLCHQNPERSPAIYGHAFAVCSRCFGVYFGLLAGFVAYPFFRSIKEIEPLPRFWLFMAVIPVGVDWLLGAFGIWENTHWSRFVTGAILGAGCAVFIVPALVEIFRLTSNRKHEKRLSN